MGARKSAGILLFRWRAGGLEVFLAHPGGPFWAKKDEGHWTIPKGEIDEGEDALTAAKRELREETGIAIAKDERALPLGTITQKGGKEVEAWAVEHPADPGPIVCETIWIAWPPRSGKTLEIPEIDRAAFFGVEEARKKIKDRQAPFLDRLIDALGGRG